jgi:hypothetical protein
MVKINGLKVFETALEAKGYSTMSRRLSFTTLAAAKEFCQDNGWAGVLDCTVEPQYHSPANYVACANRLAGHALLCDSSLWSSAWKQVWPQPWAIAGVQR